VAIPTASLHAHNVFETIISALVIVVALVFFVFITVRTGTGRLGGYELQAKVPSVDGLTVNADVRVAGIKVGSITGLSVAPNYLAIVRFRIRDDIFLPADSSLGVTFPGIGSPYLTIRPGHSPDRIVPGGEFPSSVSRGRAKS
jgi:phospholipid/cholesterol/gamma-HCH transport system substrate-binding protein